MDFISLVMGLDVNVLTKQTWENMGMLKLVWSPRQLRMENQQKVVPFGKLVGVCADVDGLRSFAYFEVI